MRNGLVAALAEELEIRESAARGSELAQEVSLDGTRVVILGHDDAADVAERLPADILVLGVSSGRMDVVVHRGDEISYLTNPSAESLAAFLREATAD